MKTAGSNLQTPIGKPCSLNHYMCHLKNQTKPTVCRNQSPNITNNLISASVVQNMIKKWHLRSEVHQRSTWISSHTPLTCTDAKYNNNDFKKFDILTCYNISLAASALTHARLFFILFFHVTRIYLFIRKNKWINQLLSIRHLAPLLKEKRTRMNDNGRKGGEERPVLSNVSISNWQLWRLVCGTTKKLL